MALETRIAIGKDINIRKPRCPQVALRPVDARGVQARTYRMEHIQLTNLTDAARAFRDIPELRKLSQKKSQMHLHYRFIFIINIFRAFNIQPRSLLLRNKIQHLLLGLLLCYAP